MKLFYSPGACSMACHITANELGMKLETEKVNLRGDRAEYLKLNPKGYVPALMTDKKEMLTEGVAIMQYLADQMPEKNLVPKAGTMERYRVMEMMNFISTEIHKGFSPLWGKDTPESYKMTVKEKLGKRMDMLTHDLQGKMFLMGNQFTICDAYLFTILSWTKMLNFDMSRWPALMGYVERIQQRPAVQAAMKSEGLI